MIKRCYACKQTKLIEDFPVNKARADGRGSMCKTCKKEYNANYYIATKSLLGPARAENKRQRRAEAAAKVYEYLRTHPCVDCGEADIVVLDFDHLSDKAAEINDLIHRGVAWSMILAEIQKCEVVCANDHRRRTARTFGWRRAAVA